MAEKLIKLSADLEVQGNLAVKGTTTTIDAQHLIVENALIVANGQQAASSGHLIGTVYCINSDATNNAYAIAYKEDSVCLGIGTYNKESGTFEFAANEGLPVAIRQIAESFKEGELLIWDAASSSLKSAGKTVDELNPTIDKVVINKDLVFTRPFGKYGTGDDINGTGDDLETNGRYTISCEVDDETTGETRNITLQELFDNAYATDTDPTVTQPSITFRGSNLGEKEVGTKVTVGYEFKNETAGSYSFGPATGVTWSGYEATFNGVTKTGKSRSFAEIQVTDAMTGNASLVLTGKATHSDGAIPKTALGKDAVNLQIKQSNKTPSYSTKLSGYRNMFVGTMTIKPATMTSADIRALANKSKSAAINNWSISIPAGTLRVIIALPSGRTLDKVLDENNSNQNIKGSFSEWSGGVNVAGANGYEPKAYTVYYMDAASGLKANTFKITIK